MTTNIFIRKAVTVCGWSLSSVIAEVTKWGADFDHVAVEPASFGSPYGASVPIAVWYGYAEEDGAWTAAPNLDEDKES
jgi:hypothetical protein